MRQERGARGGQRVTTRIYRPRVMAAQPSLAEPGGLRPRDQLVDGCRGELIVDDHEPGAPDARALAAPGRNDIQVLGRERDRAAVDHLADAGDDFLHLHAELPADDDDGGVEYAHAHRGDLADRASRGARGGDRVGIAGADAIGDLRRIDLDARIGAELGGDGRRAGGRLEVAFVEVAGNLNVPDVARGSAGAALQLAALDDSGADAGGDVDEEQIVNWDPSHMMWQNIDPVGFIWEFRDRIYHVDCKDTRIRASHGRADVLGSHLAWGDPRRAWDFVSTGHGDVPWEDAFRALRAIGYGGPISIEWEDAGMDRLHGAAEAVRYVRSLLWKTPDASFDAAFSNQ